MTLVDELLADSASRGPACSVGAILSEMDDATRAEWLAALAHQRITATKIADRLTRDGWPVKAMTLQRHRRGDCQCPSSKS